jgi:signal transduction histidine kinase
MDGIIELPVFLLIWVIVFVLFNNRFTYSKTKEIKNKIETIEKLKEGNFTREELDYISSGDKELKKLTNGFCEKQKKIKVGYEV